MVSHTPKTFEEKVNAILKYHEYTSSWKRERFLPKFAYLANDELDALLRLGQEIEQYAGKVAQGLFSFGERLTSNEDERIGKLREAIIKEYPQLDTERVNRLTARAAYNAVA